MTHEPESLPPACSSCLDRRSVLRAAAAGLAGAALVAGQAGEAVAGGTWRTLGPAYAVPVGSGKYYEPGAGQRVVVTQPTRGVFHAFTGYCTHQQGRLNRFPGRRIECELHGSQFRINNGRVLRGPATRRLPRMEVRVRNGNIQVR